MCDHSLYPRGCHQQGEAKQHKLKEKRIQIHTDLVPTICWCLGLNTDKHSALVFTPGNLLKVCRSSDKLIRRILFPEREKKKDTKVLNYTLTFGHTIQQCTALFLDLFFSFTSSPPLKWNKHTTWVNDESLLEDTTFTLVRMDLSLWSLYFLL